MVKKKSKARMPFDVVVYLETAGVKRKIVQFRKGQTIFSQGDAGQSVHYLQAGSVKITVSSSTGKEACPAGARRLFRRRVHIGPALAGFNGNGDGPSLGSGGREAGNDPRPS